MDFKRRIRFSYPYSDIFDVVGKLEINFTNYQKVRLYSFNLRNKGKGLILEGLIEGKG